MYLQGHDMAIRGPSTSALKKLKTITVCQTCLLHWLALGHGSLGNAFKTFGMARKAAESLGGSCDGRAAARSSCRRRLFEQRGCADFSGTRVKTG